METHDEGSTPVQQQEHKSKHRSKDKDRDKKEKRDRKDKSSKSSRHDRDLSAATDRPVDIANGRAETDAIAAANGLRTSPPAQAPAQHAPAEDRAAAQQPADRKAAPVVNDSGGEISMSIEETNRVRVSLGLKPLKAESDDRKKKEQEADAARRADAAKAARDAELKERVDRAREKRLMHEDLSKMTTLGSADADDDSMAAWVARSRQSEETRRAAERAAATRVASMYDQEDDDDDDEEAAQPTSTDLVGLKVRHTADEVGAGETVILTLADKGVLDEEDGDELENVLAAEEKKRTKARKAATKTGKPLFGEDGVARGLLEKYDEEAEEEGMQIEESGVVPDERARRQEEMRRKAAEAGESAANGGPASYAGANADYYTAEEMTQFIKPKRKKLKRKLRAKPTDEEPAAELSAADIAALEAAATAAASNDHGSRSGRGAELAAKEAQQRLADLKARQERYDRALEKANAATQQASSTAAIAAVIVDDDDDDFRSALDESLQRARRAAAAKPKAEDDIANEVIARRQQEDAALNQSQDVSEEMQLSEASEFAKLLKRGMDSEGGPAAPDPPSTTMMADDDDEDMDAQEPAPTPTPPVAPKAENRRFRRPAAAGGWRTEGDEPSNSDAMDIEPPVQSEAEPHVKQEPEENVTRERAVGSGLGGALALLKERGELNQSKAIVWSGRNNDMKPGKLQPVSDVFTGGKAEDEQANRIENALRRTDEFGRQKTPKEAWRELNHGFHGIDPSKNKKAKMQKKFAEEQARLRAATSEAVGGVDRLRHVTAASATPYLVLSGNVKPGQISDPSSGYATSDRAALTPVLGAQTPALGGGMTPLAGDRKVEAMLGIDRRAADKKADPAAMPPPPARAKQQR